jgi:Spy/CpxP family protein refolding chaperone
MRYIHFAIAFIVIFISISCSQNKDPRQFLNDPELRRTLFSAIIGEHDLMKQFLEQARENDHARMMVSHIMGDQSSSSHENCPMDGAAHADSSKSPYAGQEARILKSLSPEEVQQYRNGEGMGMAKAAELNHYPGPKHVLQVASDIALSKEQQASAQQLYDTMHEKAVRLGNELVDLEEGLNQSFALATIDHQKLADEMTELGRLHGELRRTHLEAHLAMKKLLTQDQIVKYDRLRGYQHTGTDQLAVDRAVH